MNFIDIVILIPVLWGFWRGFTKGAIMTAAMFAAFFLGCWGGMHLSDKFASLLRDWFSTESPYVPLISFALIFTAILFLVYGTGKLMERMVEKTPLGIINKLLGGAIGTAKFLLLMSLLFFVCDSLEKKVEIIPADKKASSLLYKPVAMIAPAIIPGLKETDLAKMIPQTDSLNLNLKIKKDTVEIDSIHP
jgi:membrane protein required for colicin V production